MLDTVVTGDRVNKAVTKLYPHTHLLGVGRGALRAAPFQEGVAGSRRRREFEVGPVRVKTVRGRRGGGDSAAAGGENIGRQAVLFDEAGAKHRQGRRGCHRMGLGSVIAPAAEDIPGRAAALRRGHAERVRARRRPVEAHGSGVSDIVDQDVQPRGFVVMVVA